jgi:hypothetical protein
MLEMTQVARFQSSRISASPPRALPSRQEDPAVDAIAQYWNAIAEWRRTDRRLKRMVKRLPEDLRRPPRVQISSLLQGTDAKTGADIKKPIYAHSEYSIRQHVKECCARDISIWASPGWIQAPNTARGWRKGRLTESIKRTRVTVRQKHRARLGRLMSDFATDRDGLYARQDAVGWRQALAAEDKARDRIARLRYRTMETKPTTLRGALALVEWIHAVNRTYINSPGENSPYGYKRRPPYGLGETYTAHVAKSVADFMKSRADAPLS